MLTFCNQMSCNLTNSSEISTVLIDQLPDTSDALAVGALKLIYTLSNYNLSNSNPAGNKGAEVTWIYGSRLKWSKNGAQVETWRKGANILTPQDPDNCNSTSVSGFFETE